MRAVGIAVALVVAGCDGKDGSGSTTEESCETCADNGELCVVYADGDNFDNWEETCEPMPAECQVSDPCGVNECIATMYDTCRDGWYGQANSCSGPYVSVTCSGSDTTTM
jgi:hypothetical protein